MRVPHPSNKAWQVLRVNRAAGRWTDWTRMLLERLQLRPAMFQRPYYVLRVGCAREGTTYVSKWTQVLQQFFPRIHLAIDHVLAKSDVRSVIRDMSGSVALHRLEKQTYFGDRSSLMSEEGKVRSNQHTSPVSIPVLPVQRLFARGVQFAGTDLTVEQRMGMSTVLTEMCHRVVRRVLEKSERIEERRMQSLVLRREMRTVVEADSDSRPKETISTSPWGASVGKSGFAMTNGQMPIDLNRLTDQVVHQIDGRISAYRERMGRVF